MDTVQNIKPQLLDATGVLYFEWIAYCFLNNAIEKIWCNTQNDR